MERMDKSPHIYICWVVGFSEWTSSRNVSVYVPISDNGKSMCTAQSSIFKPLCELTKHLREIRGTVHLVLCTCMTLYTMSYIVVGSNQLYIPVLYQSASCKSLSS